MVTGEGGWGPQEVTLWWHQGGRGWGSRQGWKHLLKPGWSIWCPRGDPKGNSEAGPQLCGHLPPAQSVGGVSGGTCGCSLHPPSTSRADPVPAGPALTSVCRFMCSRRVNFFPQISQG